MRERLVVGTEHEAEFRLLEIIERLAPQLLAEAGKSKDICANVDLYGGCVYSVGHSSPRLLTPMFGPLAWLAGARTVSKEIVSGKYYAPAFRKRAMRASMSTSPIENSPVLLNWHGFAVVNDFRV